MGPREGRDARDRGQRRQTLRCLADMLRPHGMPSSEAIFESGNQNNYAFMAERLLGQLADLEPPDLVVAAHTTPDCDPGRSLSGHLATLLPTGPFCFAISDQGELGPFSALNAIRGLAAAGWPISSWRSALMLALDQSTLPYPRPGHAGSAAPDDHVVGLLFSTDPAASGRPLAAVRQRQAVSPGGVRAALAEIAGELPPSPAPVTVLAGAGLSAADLPARLWGAGAADDGEPAGPLVMARPGPPCVAVWASLIRVLAGPRPGRILVTEYDPALGGLGVAVLDPATVAARAGHALEVTA